jgi:hypothetical protein
MAITIEFPNGMKIRGDDADEVVLAAQQFSEGKPQPQPKIDEPKTSVPFLDPKIDQYHPVIRELELKILGDPIRSVYDLIDMRKQIGKILTGDYRECRTRAVSRLMTRLTKCGITSQVKRDTWEKVSLIGTNT